MQSGEMASFTGFTLAFLATSCVKSFESYRGNSYKSLSQINTRISRWHNQSPQIHQYRCWYRRWRHRPYSGHLPCIWCHLFFLWVIFGRTWWVGATSGSDSSSDVSPWNSLFYGQILWFLKFNFRKNSKFLEFGPFLYPGPGSICRLGSFWNISGLNTMN